MAGALGINEPGCSRRCSRSAAFLAGLAGALQIPRETVKLQMDLAILVEAFVVVVVGGLGSVSGALWASLAIGLLHAFGMWWLPQSTLVLIFVVMAVVLSCGRTACSGAPAGRRRRQAADAPAVSCRVRVPRQWLWLAALRRSRPLLPLVARRLHAVVIATEMAILALLAASLQFAWATAASCRSVTRRSSASAPTRPRCCLARRRTVRAGAARGADRWRRPRRCWSARRAALARASTPPC